MLSGNLKKMSATAPQVQVQYRLTLGDDSLNMNDLIGQKIELHFKGAINCTHCGRVSKKSFSQGFCFPCF
ncbi:DUF2797 domain-containing protein, partial [Marinomonas arenicola]|uniref:DUF2797 domain-containing protein n=1 Tax=Marinomonas arenicola TaxID=569601 RepID=UPI00311F653D